MCYRKMCIVSNSRKIIIFVIEGNGDGVGMGTNWCRWGGDGKKNLSPCSSLASKSGVTLKTELATLMS